MKKYTGSPCNSRFFITLKIPTYLNKSSHFRDEQDSRESSPQPSSDLLDSLCPNCTEYLPASQPSISAEYLSQASQPRISVEHLSRASQPSISAKHLSNAQKYSAMFNNAQECSTILNISF